MTSSDFPDDFEFITAMQNAKTRAEDFQRLQDSIAGRETGHGNKHHRGDNEKNLTRMGRKKTGMSAFEMLMSDPAYVALRSEAFDLLGQAETLVGDALQQAQDKFTASTQRLDELRDNANQLPDGRKAYRDKQGNVRAEDGAIVTGPEVDGLIWNDSHTSYEAVKAEKETNAAAKRQVEDHSQKQIDLGETRNRMEDEENPLSKEALEKITKDLERDINLATSKEIDSEKNPDSVNQKTVDVDTSEINLDGLNL